MASLELSLLLSVTTAWNLIQFLKKCQTTCLWHMYLPPDFYLFMSYLTLTCINQDTPTLWRLHRYVNAVLSPRATPQAPPKNPNKRVGSSIHNKNPSKRTKRPPSPWSVTEAPRVLRNPLHSVEVWVDGMHHTLNPYRSRVYFKTWDGSRWKIVNAQMFLYI